MSLREKLKRAFKSTSPTTSKNPSPVVVQEEIARWPSNVYRPGEPLPRLKYRAPVKKEHKEKLEAFNFGASWRRRSGVSIHSPGGSRRNSRPTSRIAQRSSLSGPASETRRKSIAQGRESMDARRGSVVLEHAKARRTSLAKEQADEMAETSSIMTNHDTTPVDSLCCKHTTTDQSAASPAVELSSPMAGLISPMTELPSFLAVDQVQAPEPVINEIKPKGMITSTVAVVIPPKSAKVITTSTPITRPQLVKQRSRPRPVSVLIHPPARSFENANTKLNPNTVAPAVFFDRAVAPPAIPACVSQPPTPLENPGVAADAAPIPAATATLNKLSLASPSPPPVALDEQPLKRVGPRPMGATNKRLSVATRQLVVALDAKKNFGAGAVTVMVEALDSPTDDQSGPGDEMADFKALVSRSQGLRECRKMPRSAKRLARPVSTSLVA